MHLILDGKVANKLNNQVLKEFLTACPDVISMTRISEPLIRNNGETIMGVVFIAESHISVHSNGEICWCDIFSCKNFNREAAMEFAIKSLGLLKGTIYHKVLDWRGITPGCFGDFEERYIGDS